MQGLCWVWNKTWS